MQMQGGGAASGPKPQNPKTPKPRPSFCLIYFLEELNDWKIDSACSCLSCDTCLALTVKFTDLIRHHSRSHHPHFIRIKCATRPAGNTWVVDSGCCWGVSRHGVIDSTYDNCPAQFCSRESRAGDTKCTSGSYSKYYRRPTECFEQPWLSHYSSSHLKRSCCEWPFLDRWCLAIRVVKASWGRWITEYWNWLVWRKSEDGTQR